MSVSIFPDPNTAFRQATAEDVPAILALVELVRSNLTEAQQHFLKEKSASEILSYIEAGFPTVLAFRGNQLAAIAVSTPQTPDMNLGATNLPGMFNRGHYMCVGTVAVNPDMRGMGMGQQIISKAFEASSDYINSEESNPRLMGVIAKVSTTNTGSQRAFLANEFSQSVETHYDPQGDYHFQIFSRIADNLPAIEAVPASERERRAAEVRANGRHFHHG